MKTSIAFFALLVGVLLPAATVYAGPIAQTTTTTTVSNAVRCSQPVSDGFTPTATDCLFILRAAVGLVACTPPCICDVNGDSVRTATDALSCLNVAVGVNLPLRCQCGPSTTNTSTTSTTMGTVRGVCCGRRSCVIIERDRCVGTYLRDSSNDVCSVEEQAACTSPPTTIPVSSGVCCTTTKCLIATRDRCSGTYLGDSSNQVCSPEEQAACNSPTTTLPPSGACCFQRQCVIVPATACFGVYLGDRAGTVCSDADSEQCLVTTTTSTTTTTTTLGPATTTTLGGTRVGVCCESTGCSVVAPEDCSGVYLGDREEGGVCTIADELQCALVGPQRWQPPAD